MLLPISSPFTLEYWLTRSLHTHATAFDNMLIIRIIVHGFRHRGCFSTHLRHYHCLPCAECKARWTNTYSVILFSSCWEKFGLSNFEPKTFFFGKNAQTFSFRQRRGRWLVDWVRCAVFRHASVCHTWKIGVPLASAGQNLIILRKISGVSYWLPESKPGGCPDSVNFLRLCLGYLRHLVQWDCHRCNLI